MREVTYEEYRNFFQNHKEVVIEGKPVKLVDWGHIIDSCISNGTRLYFHA